VQVCPPEEPQRARDYSLASLPSEGRIELLVRLARRADGQAGRASGWLGQTLAVGTTVPLRWRAQRGFHIQGNETRPLILIGNGSGLAGLLSHIKARAQTRTDHGGPPPAPIWLIFGERQAAHDAHLREHLEAWQAQGLIAHLDWAFSRDTPPRHVQDALAAELPRLHDWLARGAALYVCGSRQGMAASIDTLLRETLGEARLQRLQEAGRYRRDVY